MNLKQLLDTLRYGELANMNYFNEDKVPAIITYLNSALIQLYSRFPLSEKQLIIEQHPHIATYHISSKYARSNKASLEPYKYIIDSEEEPFQDDVIRVTSAYNKYGEPVPLNDQNDLRSWFLPSYNSVQIFNSQEGDTAFFIYRARHSYINPEVQDYESVLIDIPACLEEALCSYIASKAYITIQNQEGISLSGLYENRYEKLCSAVEANNLLQSESSNSNIKLFMRGFA